MLRESINDPQGGREALILKATGNVVSVANVESITGGGGADVVTVTTSFGAGDSVDLQGGTDTLILSASGNVVAVANVETITRIRAAAVVTRTASLVSGRNIELH